MITLFVFYVHVIAAATIFTKRWQEVDRREGFLAIGFLALVFSVGWSISAFLLKALIDEKGFGVWLDRDTLSLLLLLIMESIFFYFQLRRKRRKLKTV
jgi:uncharacterized membrane protein YhdT